MIDASKALPQTVPQAMKIMLEILKVRKFDLKYKTLVRCIRKET